MTLHLNADLMMLAAERTSGLADWGRDFFLRPFQTLIDSLNTEAKLNDLGLRRTERRLSDTLLSRLRLVDDRKRFPQIAAERIAAPIFCTTCCRKIR
jgi:hypothetical protein